MAFRKQSSTASGLVRRPMVKLQDLEHWPQGCKAALTRIVIGTKGLFVKSQVWFSEPGLWSLYLIVCSYPEPVRMVKCQNFCTQQQQLSVNGSSGVRPSCGERQERLRD
jgi:hypothetical protein